MKQVLEGATPTLSALHHLDRCLTCRNCESTCPSGVQYSKLLDIGRDIIGTEVSGPGVKRPSARWYAAWWAAGRCLAA